MKEPRKVQLQFIKIDAKSPTYKNAQPALQAASTIAGAMTSGYLGGGAMAGTLEVAAPILAEPLYLKEELSRKTEEKHRDTLFDYNWDFRRVKPRDSSIYNPYPDAGLTAQLATMMNPIAGLPAAIAGYDNLINWVETRDRVRFGVQLSLAPYNSFFPLLTAIGPAFANAPADPKSVYELEAIEKLKNVERPETLAEKDLQSLVNKLTDLRKSFQIEDPQKKEAPKIDQAKMEQANREAHAFIEQWLKNHPNVVTGQSALLDNYQLADDPALKDVFADLKDHPKIPDLPELLRRLFYFSAPKEPVEAGLYAPSGLSLENRFTPFASDFSKPVYIVWKIDDREAKAFKHIADIDPEKLLRAWKMTKARAGPEGGRGRRQGSERSGANRTSRFQEPTGVSDQSER